MKTKVTKILLFAMVLILAVACLASCNNDDKNKHVVTLMDGDTQITTVSVTDGKTIDMSTINKLAQKDGVSFIGWYTDKELTTPFVQETEITKDVTLYAKYEAQSLYIIVDSKGGSAVSKVKVQTGETYTVEAPTREGYTFTGYTLYDYDEEKDVEFTTTGTYKLTTDARITANWEINKYTVAFYDGETKLDQFQQTVEHGKTATLSVYAKEGYDFNGWKEKDATETFKATTAITKNVNLYASFTAKTYTISVNSNGGDAVADYTATFGEAYSLSAPTRTGYTFTGYTYNGEAFALTGTYNIVGAVRLVANWTINTYTVTYKDSEEEVISTVENVAYGTTVTGVANKAGYTTEGYYLTKEFDGEKVTLSSYAITEDTVLFVKYIANQYTITVINYSDANCIVAFDSDYELPTAEELMAAKAEEWLSFDGYKFGTADGAAFERTGKFTWAENITVVATYTKNPMYLKSTVTLLDGATQMGETVVDDGANIAAFLSGIDTSKTGYTFNGWYTSSGFEAETAFNMSTDTIDADTILYAKYTANTYTITIVANGWTVASSINVTYGQAFVLPTPTDKSGYTYVGYTYGGETFVSGTYTYTTDIQIEIVDSRNTVTVHFISDGSSYGDAVVIYQNETFADVNKPAVDPAKTGYTFKWWSATVNGEAVDADAEIEENADFYAVFEANTYYVVITRDESTDEDIAVVYNEEYTIPTAPIRFGYTFVKYVYTDGGADFTGPFNGVWQSTSNLYLTIIWEDNTFIKDSEKKYFKEVENGNNYYTYVFLTGESYQFAGYNVTPDALINNTAPDTFTAVVPGNFELALIPTAGGDTVTYQAKVVYSIGTIGMGSDYQAMIANVNDATKFQEITTASDYVMTAGISNFVPDVSITNDSFVAMTIDQANIELLLKKDETDLDPDLAGRTGNTFNFDSSLAGKTVTVTLQSKYDIKANPTTLSMKLALNNGVNVYNNAQMKTNYANKNVSTINVLRNITAELVASDYLPGHGEAYGNVTLSTGTLENINIGAPKNEFNNSVYTRTTNDTTDRIVVNGNYFAIDGSKLPYIDNRYDQYGAAGSNLTSGDAYRLANTQIGIFLYRCADVTADTTGQIRKFHQGTVTFNNLRIQANNLYNAAAEEDLGDGGFPLLKMSAAYMGFVLRGGTMALNNVAIKDTSMGFMVHGSVSGYETPGKTADSLVMGNVQPEETQSAHLVLNSCIVENSWANHIYTFDLAKVTLTNTKLTGSCGPAISVDDRPYAKAGTTGASDYGYSNLDTELIMDVYTTKNINSWVAGNEAWFLAYGMGTLAPGVKTTIHNTVSSNTSGAMGSSKIIGGDEKMNFIVLVRPVGTWTSTITSEDISGGPHVKSQTIDGGFSFFYKDEAEYATVGTEAMKFNDDLTAYGTALGYYQATSDASYLQTAMAKYGDLMTAGRPFVNQSQSAGTFGTVQIFVAAYYAHELLQ